MATPCRLISAIGVLALTVGFIAPAQAQDLCKPEETISICWERLRTELLAKPEKKVQQQAAQNTETSLADAVGLSSSVKDFLPLLQLGGVLGAVQTDDKSGVMSVALNMPFFGSRSTGDGGNEADNQLQLKATIESKPKLYGPLAQLLPQDGRAEAAARMVAARMEAQNFTLHAGYSVSSTRLGRSFARHADTLNALYGRVAAGAGSEKGLGALALALLTKLETANISTTTWTDMTNTDRHVVAELLPALVKADVAHVTDFSARAREYGLDVYGQLILNQPQLHFSVSRTVRDDLFGPTLTTARVTFEIGMGNNLNAALGAFRTSCKARPGECLSRYKAFTDDPATRAALKAGTRLAFSFELVSNEDYHFVATAPALDLAIKAGIGWTAALDAGRLIGVDDRGNVAGRVDASLKWEVPADNTRDGRLVGSLTVTKKLGEVSVPFSIVYANKSKYLTGVDYGLSANVGLKFNLFSKEQ